MTINHYMAIVEYGKRLVEMSSEMKPLQRDYARVRIRANGVCATDVKLVDGVGFHPELPFVPGHEPAGQVEEVNSDSEKYKNYVGRKFVVHPHITCGECENCLSGRENVCLALKGSLGISINGAFSEYVDVPLRNLIPVPDSMDFPYAALAGGVVAVPLLAIRNLGDLMNRDVVVIGTGGLAMVAIQILKNGGSNVIVVGRKDEKLQMASELGASFVINSTQADYVKEIRHYTAGIGADYVLDLAGDPKEVPVAINSLKRGGTFSVVGYSSSTINLDYKKIALDAIKIQGSRSYTRNDLRISVDLIKNHLVKPIISHRFPLESANEAISVVRSGTSIGRVVLEF
ncbi:MAG: alcohol dehydrogenase catalytic domain-containing protein [Thermoplasmata archaeon]